MYLDGVIKLCCICLCMICVGMIEAHWRSWALWVNPSTPKPGSGTTTWLATSSVPLWTPSGRQKQSVYSCSPIHHPHTLIYLTPIAPSPYTHLTPTAPPPYYTGCTLMFHPFYTHNPHCLPTDYHLHLSTPKAPTATLTFFTSIHLTILLQPHYTPHPHCSTNKHTLIHTFPSNIPHPCVPPPHTLHLYFSIPPSHFYGTLVKQWTRRNSITETLF